MGTKAIQARDEEKRDQTEYDRIHVSTRGSSTKEGTEDGFVQITCGHERFPNYDTSIMVRGVRCSSAKRENFNSITFS